MSKKGFTLVELLAVIIILSLLALLATNSITKIVKDSKTDLSNTQKELITAATQIWAADNLNRLPSTGECGYLTLGDLKEYGVIDSNVIDPATNQSVSDDLKIKISTESNSSRIPKIIYEADPDSVEGCQKIHALYLAIRPATESTKTTGNVPLGNFDSGDEYIINIGGEDRIFFVLKEHTNDSSRVDLIMNKNIGNLVAWSEDEQTVTANVYLASQTSNWEVTPYLPNRGQVNAYSGSSMPIWLYDYLDSTLHSVPGVYGYWTSVENNNKAHAVEYDGLISQTPITYSGSFGVRPVITIPKYLFD